MTPNAPNKAFIIKQSSPAMSTKSYKRVVLFLAGAFLLLSPIQNFVGACPPQCPPCYYWNGSRCVWGCASGYFCCNYKCCKNGNSCCNNQTCCNTDNCYKCQGSNCVSECDPDTQYCCGGTCCSNDNCCTNGQCLSTCWTPESVPASAEVCPDCSGFFTGCEGIIEVINGYSEWGSADSGEVGWCKNPTKLETVGFLFECTEDWKVSQIVACAAESAACAYVCSSAPWWACVACLVYEGIDCALEGMCSFVEDCIPGDALQPVERQVIDTGADWGDSCKG
jgi:hypothetical protein